MPMVKCKQGEKSHHEQNEAKKTISWNICNKYFISRCVWIDKIVNQRTTCKTNHEFFCE
jgi:hypothetical protein